MYNIICYVKSWYLKFWNIMNSIILLYVYGVYYILYHTIIYYMFIIYTYYIFFLKKNIYYYILYIYLLYFIYHYYLLYITTSFGIRIWRLNIICQSFEAALSLRAETLPSASGHHGTMRWRHGTMRSVGYTNCQMLDEFVILFLVSYYLL